MYRKSAAILLCAALFLSGCGVVPMTANGMAGETETKQMETGKSDANMAHTYETTKDFSMMPSANRKSTETEESGMKTETTENVIYFAGGCFWGMEQLMQSIPGVIDAESGYANGTCKEDADYKTVCKGKTGFRETVRVEYNPDEVSLDALLLAYFYVIDPTVENRQGNDVGTQYQTGVYYTSDAAKETVERIAAIEKGGARSSLWK